jgi:hypothetical protein
MALTRVRTRWANPRGRSGCAAFLAFSRLFLVESRAEAEDIERIAVSYDAPTSCPNEDTFIREIAARTSKLRRVEPSEASRAIRVTLSDVSPGMTRGVLVLADRDGESERVVHDAHCAVVVSGLALIAALAIDPDAETGPVEDVHAPPPPPGPKPASPPVADVVAKRPRAIAIGAAAGGGLRVGVVPAAAMFTIAGIVGLENPSFVHPQARLELSASAPATDRPTDTGPGARLRWFGGHLEGCGLFGRSRLRVGPCALFELGAVHASGLGVKDAQSTTRAGAAMGAGVRGVLTSGLFYADLGAFPLVPFRRDRFYAEPNTTLFQTTAVGAEVGANVGMVF